MSFAFHHHHAAMLLKYSGISFISGAVNHGFFSGERSLWTAAIGVGLFALGAALEHRLSDSAAEPEQSGLGSTVLIGALLSVGLGFFTGGLQHFPDSPERSAWVVPVGFFLSVLALSLGGAHTWRTSSSAYVVVAGILVSLSSYGAWQWLVQHPSGAMAGHTHAHESHESQDTAAPTLSAWTVSRSVEVRMDDQMRFIPDQIEVRAGETIHFVVHNDGRVTHEMVLGDAAQIQAHAKAMKSTASHAHSHDQGTALSVPAGQKREWVVKFGQAGRLQVACLVPGHYEAGMRGTIDVK